MLRERGEGWGIHSDARLSGFNGFETNTCNTIGFLVEEHNVGYIAEFGTFVAYVFFDVENSARVFLGVLC